MKCAEEVARELRRGVPRGLLRRQECFVAILVDAQLSLVGRPFVVAVGSLAECVVHPRDVFRKAVARNARGLFIAHNHPSGVLTPSQYDLELTARLVACGELLGIEVIDHLILGLNEHASLRELGVLKGASHG